MHHKLGYQEEKILLYLLKNPGVTTYRLTKTLNLSNRTEMRLEEKGLIENRGREDKKAWYVTKAGLIELKLRELI